MAPTSIFTTILCLAVSASLILWCVLSLQRKAMARAKSEKRWRWMPPIANGARLVLWGADVAETVAKTVLRRNRTKKALPAELATEILQGTGFAIKHLPLMNPSVDFADCRTRHFSRIGVTAPEILAIADIVRQDKKEAARIHDIAVENAKRLAETEDDRKLANSLVCPLRSPEGSCLAGHFCPLHCRVTCDKTQMVSPDHVRMLEDVSRDVGFGVEVGLSRALKSAELDGHVYELNSALAVALEDPHASRKWANGENVLAKCMPNDYTAYV